MGSDHLGMKEKYNLIGPHLYIRGEELEEYKHKNQFSSSLYFILLLCIFLLEIIAGILACVYYQQLNNELKENLRTTIIKKYRKAGEESVTNAVDKLQQEFKCCGSHNYTDWRESYWFGVETEGRKVPDSCCKTMTHACGKRDHPSNIYKEGGCITKLGNFIQEHLIIIGAVGLSIAFVQVCNQQGLNYAFSEFDRPVGKATLPWLLVIGRL
ncbi:PREDICTED: CD151 antigen [Thamnophis sirtalis]|uniref:CD151 antigen n=1 Tax=Thamnophis sirtalis TaxID=35019 RepID=A0A6I9XR66_9SAUR|nr:PREDICTED: CD151 antigen [Thamnophis sirtalis]